MAPEGAEGVVDDALRVYWCARGGLERVSGGGGDAFVGAGDGGGGEVCGDGQGEVGVRVRVGRRRGWCFELQW